MCFIMVFHPMALGLGVLIDCEDDPVEFGLTVAFWSIQIHWHKDPEVQEYE